MSTDHERKGGEAVNSPKKWKLQFIIAAAVLLVSFVSLVSVTFAWYVYQTGARTSDIHMAVGTGSSLQISNRYDGAYGNSTVMDEFHGFLNPVSTDRIQNGFQNSLPISIAILSA